MMIYSPRHTKDQLAQQVFASQTVTSTFRQRQKVTKERRVSCGLLRQSSLFGLNRARDFIWLTFNSNEFFNHKKKKKNDSVPETINKQTVFCEVCRTCSLRFGSCWFSKKALVNVDVVQMSSCTWNEYSKTFHLSRNWKNLFELEASEQTERNRRV